MFHPEFHRWSKAGLLLPCAEFELGPALTHIDFIWAKSSLALALWSFDFELFRLDSGVGAADADSFGRFGAETEAVAMALFLNASRSRSSSEFIMMDLFNTLINFSYLPIFRFLMFFVFSGKCFLRNLWIRKISFQRCQINFFVTI